MTSWKLALARVAVILTPSWTAAWLTGEMVWTIPTLAAAASVAAAIKDTGAGGVVERTDADGDGGTGDGDSEDG